MVLPPVDNSAASTTECPSLTVFFTKTSLMQCPAGEDDVKQDIQDWTIDAPAAVCGGDEPMLLFTSVTICDTVVAREPGSTGQYTLYVIEVSVF